MTRRSRVTALLLALTLSAAGPGCSGTSMGGAQRTALTTLGGAATGVLIGGLAGGGKGAAIGAGAGAAAGLIGGLAWSAYEDQKSRDISAEDRKLAKARGYDLSTQPVLAVRSTSAVPTRVKRGDEVKLGMEYTVITPKSSPKVTVDESFEIWHQNQLVTSSPTHASVRDDGVWKVTQELTIPDDLQPGTYELRSLVETKTSAGTGSIKETSRTTFNVAA